jgi:Gamma-glutamyl cyclotransferase, AIG2-like
MSMIRYFAYGSNMCVRSMRVRCPCARAIGKARVDGWRYVISSEGFGSIVPAAGSVVHGVLWHVSPRGVASLNAYENIQSGLYVRRFLPVRCGTRLISALVYVGAGRPRTGRPAIGAARPGYQRLVVAAARQWHLPDPYVRSLERWGVSPIGNLAAEAGGIR